MSGKRESTKQHFSNRAERFNVSARWVRDARLLDKMFQMSVADSHDVALDIATGTGQVAKRFAGRVGALYGVDICQEMVLQNKYVNELVYANAEAMPFKDEMFDLVICRQGLQFMELFKVVSEIERVLKPGGRVVLAHLTCYSEGDKDETFRSLELRNAARRNFFTPDDLPRMLLQHGLTPCEFYDYPCRETVFDWLDHGAMEAERVEEAMSFYHLSSLTFKRLHQVTIEDGKIDETMNMQIIKARKTPQGLKGLK